MEPGLVSYLVHTTFMLNLTLRGALIHLNNADITSLLAWILPHLPKPKNKAKGKEPTGRAQEDVVYWIGEDADNCVVFASTKPRCSEMTRCAFGSAPIGHKERLLPASKMDRHLSGLEFGNQFRTCLCGSVRRHYHCIPYGRENGGTTEAMSVAMG